MLSLKKNLSEGLSGVASATTSAASNAASATTSAASNAASAASSAASKAASASNLDGLRNSLSEMSPVEQLKEIKGKQAEKFAATSSQLMSILDPTEELGELKWCLPLPSSPLF